MYGAANFAVAGPGRERRRLVGARADAGPTSARGSCPARSAAARSRATSTTSASPTARSASSPRRRSTGSASSGPISPGARPVRSTATGRLVVSPGVLVDYGGRYSRYDYLPGTGLFSPRDRRHPGARQGRSHPRRRLAADAGARRRGVPRAAHPRLLGAARTHLRRLLADGVRAHVPVRPGASSTIWRQAWSSRSGRSARTRPTSRWRSSRCPQGRSGTTGSPTRRRHRARLERRTQQPAAVAPARVGRVRGDRGPLAARDRPRSGPAAARLPRRARRRRRCTTSRRPSKPTCR